MTSLTKQLAIYSTDALNFLHIKEDDIDPPEMMISIKETATGLISSMIPTFTNINLKENGVSTSLFTRLTTNESNISDLGAR